MSEENRCSQCGATLPADTPHGLCPRCLLQWGLASRAEGGEAGNEAAAGHAPPTPAELAGYFPDLEILELVGRGGMGVVYKARQKRLDRLVALKILAPGIGRDPAFAERFAREAQAMAILTHPHIVAVYDFGETDGLYYFLMEYVDGASLRRLLDTGKLAPEEALAIVPQVCDALQYAHDHGVVHRDIKPENVLLDKEGRVKIADFGIAKLVGRDAKDPMLTGAGEVVGTPQYMAPEQIEHPLQVDHRADIYSLGVVFYQMLTGELPIGRFAPPSKKVQIDVRLDEVVLRSLEKEPERRYQQASEIKTEVETIASTPPHMADLGATGSASAPSHGSLENGAIARARRQVQGPAIGLLVTGILNAAAMFLIGLLIAWYVLWGVKPMPDLPVVLAFFFVPGVVFATIILVAALNMRRLEGYGWAIFASILAVISGNLIGFAAGIWALVVLSDANVRKGFQEQRRLRFGGEPPRPTGLHRLFGAMALMVCLVALPVLSLPVGFFKFLMILIVALGAILLGFVGRKSRLGRAAVLAAGLLLLPTLTGLVVGFVESRMHWWRDNGGRAHIQRVHATSAPAARPDSVVDVGRHPGGPWIASLPSGVTVELLGVGKDDNKSWWKPDGLPLTVAPCELTRRYSPADNGRVNRVFFANVKNRPAEPIGMTYEVTPGISSSFTASVKQHGKEVRNFVDFMVFDALLPGTVDTVTVRYGISAGPWSKPMATWWRQATWPSPNPPVRGEGSNDPWSGLMIYPIETRDGVVTGAFHNLTDEIRLVAHCDDGREVVAKLDNDVSQAADENTPGSPAKIERQQVTRATFTNLALRQIKEITLQTRPYRWVEFHNVSLQPGQKTDVQVVLAGTEASAARNMKAEALAANTVEELKRFDTTAELVTKDGISVERNAWRIEAKGNRTVRLFEIPGPGAEDCRVIYRAKMKTDHLEGRAYLEMWCRIPGSGEYFSKGLNDAVTGTTDWATYETPFFLQKGQRPDLIKLDVVVEGKGTLWIKDVELLKSPFPSGEAVHPALTEKDLVEMLRCYGECYDRTFPEGLDDTHVKAIYLTLGPTIGRKKLGMVEGRQPTQEQITAFMKLSVMMERGFKWVRQLPPEADSHYAGKGVSLGAAGKPIFWYRPKDAKKYRVIYADLSVREADAAPLVPNAQALLVPPSPKK